MSKTLSLSEAQIEEIQKKLDFICAFTGIVKALGNYDSFPESLAPCDLYTLGKEAEDRVCEIKDIFWSLKDKEDDPSEAEDAGNEEKEVFFSDTFPVCGRCNTKRGFRTGRDFVFIDPCENCGSGHIRITAEAWQEMTKEEVVGKVVYPNGEVRPM